MDHNNTGTDALKKLFAINYQVLQKNLDGVTHQDSLIQPNGGGNCLNWVLGHLLATRDNALQLLNQEPVWNSETSSIYQRGSEPIRDGSRALPLEKIVSDLGRSQGRLMAGLASLQEPALSAPSPDTSIAETVGELLFVLQYHEAYHAGQAGLLRRMAGHEGAIK